MAEETTVKKYGETVVSGGADKTVPDIESDVPPKSIDTPTDSIANIKLTIQSCITRLEAMPKSDASILAIGKLKGAIKKLN